MEEDKGPRQPEEGAVDPADLSEEDVLDVMRRTGVDYLDDLPVAREYYLYDLGVLRRADDRTQPPDGRRPWWRFWG